MILSIKRTSFILFTFLHFFFHTLYFFRYFKSSHTSSLIPCLFSISLSHYSTFYFYYTTISIEFQWVSSQSGMSIAVSLQEGSAAGISKCDCRKRTITKYEHDNVPETHVQHVLSFYFQLLTPSSSLLHLLFHHSISIFYVPLHFVPTSFLSPPSCLSLQLSCLSFSTLLLSIPSLIPFSFLFCLSQISPQCFLYIMQILCFHKIENVFLIDSYTSHALSLPLLLRCKLLSLSLSFVFFYDAFCSLLVAFPQNDVISLTQTLLFNDFLFYLVILEDLPYKTVSLLLIGHLVYWVSSRITSYVLPLR